MGKSVQPKESNLKLSEILNNQKELNTLSKAKFVSQTPKNINDLKAESQHFEMINENPSLSIGETLGEHKSSHMVKTAL